LIAVDTSALIAILLKEPPAQRCIDALSTESTLLMSAATMAEALIVAARRGFGAEMVALLDHLVLQVIDVDTLTAQRVAKIYVKWGKGLHPAGLNFGDCFAYDVAQNFDCPLLYVGKDFARTDVQSALQT
jgi:ribonuclease VapC